MVDYTVTDTVVAGRDGDIPVRDYLPGTPTPSSPLLWIHGGGFAIGGLDQVESDAPARYLADRGRRVRTIDYRLAPNIGIFRNPRLGADPGRFPAAHHDVLDVAESLRTIAGAVSIGGASAGANLAAGAMLALRDEGRWMPRSAVLLYGAFHSVVPDDPEIESALRGPVARWFFNPAMTRRISLNYVGAESGLADPYAFPGGADPTGLPPSLLVDARNDRLRRSGHAFHGELLRAGVVAKELVVDAGHGFLGSPRKPAFAQAMTAMDEWLTLHD